AASHHAERGTDAGGAAGDEGEEECDEHGTTLMPVRGALGMEVPRAVGTCSSFRGTLLDWRHA
ncbi:MAG: hypothetical protein ACTHWF_06400, partial [Brachybacterium sp.]